ncbi:hypothetical protein WMY93_014883 [Mugilogobius chulae]|uniref:NAD(P)(+)--arginine ADP-ribosyltransferase n=1 Tax=Mugilogobius chulae TaxID=88201 RepID=A0AAW0NWS6_9GOBI
MLELETGGICKLLNTKLQLRDDFSYKTLSARRISAFCARKHSSLTTELIENMDKKSTWDRFYTENNRQTPTFKNFEWFFGFDSIRHIILPLISSPKPNPDHVFQVLDIGCGTSALGPCIFKHSPSAVHVTCADISPIAVKLMQENITSQEIQANNASSQLSFVEMDCTHLLSHFKPKSIDLIVDKGTTDALLRSKEGKGKARLMLSECVKVLRSSGALLQFSDEDPDARQLWLETELRKQGIVGDVVTQEVGKLRGVSAEMGSLIQTLVFSWMFSIVSAKVIKPTNSTNQDLAPAQPTKLNMVAMSVDDMYSGCTDAMTKRIAKEYFPNEMKNPKFKASWNGAKDCLQKALKNRKPVDHALTENHLRAICMYTADDIYKTFNHDVQSHGPSYGTGSFKYHTLQFWLTYAIRSSPPTTKLAIRWSGEPPRF